jgi:hypothetical protein
MFAEFSCYSGLFFKEKNIHNNAISYIQTDHPQKKKKKTKTKGHQ